MKILNINTTVFSWLSNQRWNFALWLLCALILGSAPNTANSQNPQAPTKFTVGYVKLSEQNVHNELIESTSQWLRASFGNRIAFRDYTVSELSKALRQGEVDFVLSTSGFYREHLGEGLKDLATSAYSKGTDPNKSLGSVFITLRSKKNINTLSDIQGKSISALSEDSFVGWQMAAREIILAGKDPTSFFGAILRRSMPMDNIVDDVLAGRAEVGILRDCQLEEYQGDGYPGIDRIKAIALQDTPGFHCQHSTRLYAAYTFSAATATSGNVAKDVTLALLNMPPTQKTAFTWSVCTDFKEVDSLFKDLKIGPFAYLKHMTFERFLEEYRLFLILSLVIVLGLLLHSIRTQHLVSIRTFELRKALRTQIQLQKQTQENSRRLELYERQAALQHISGILAHELKQPLTSMGYFVNGVIRKLKRRDSDIDSMVQTLEKVSLLTKISSEIIDNVRGAAKQKIERRCLNIEDFVNQTMLAYQNSALFNGACSLSWNIESGLTMQASPFEMTLVLLNLVKNAVDAVENTQNGKVHIEAHASMLVNQKALVLTIADNGPGDKQAIRASLASPFQSTKREGLGLGLSIVKRIVESYGGKVDFESNTPVGIKISVWMLLQSEDNSKESDNG